MKIAMVSFYSGHIERGVETWTQQLSTLLRNLGNEVTVFQNGPNRAGQVNTVVLGDNLNLATPASGGIRRGFFLDYYSRKIAKFGIALWPYFQRSKFDVIIPANGGWLTVLTRLYTWIMGGKLLMVSHSGYGWDDRFNAWCFPDAFVGLSMVACKWLKGVNPLLKVEHIPVGVDVHKFNPSVKPARVDLPKPLILVVAALEKSKQVELTVRAVAKNPKWGLLILGKGSEEIRLRALCDRLLPNRYQIQAVPFENIPGFYRSADVFSLASAPGESYPAVYLEAMSSGLPVVATDDPVRREIVGDAGMFVDPADEEKYSHTLEEAIKIHWGEKPRNRALDHAWPKVAEMFNMLCQDLAR